MSFDGLPKVYFGICVPVCLFITMTLNAVVIFIECNYLFADVERRLS